MRMRSRLANLINKSRVVAMVMSGSVYEKPGIIMQPEMAAEEDQ